ncbi:MAG: response regulator transcription factor [Candidatus Wallbacteria bacterium]|nr:response regulator transcription factor [Candidatus Wallbacteria bacterium]
MRVLIAEDERSVLSYLEGLVREWGYEVEGYENGQQAFDALAGQDGPKLLLLDWMLPGLTAIDITQKLRAVETDVPHYVIIITVLGGQEKLAEAFAVGVNDFIAKPFGMLELQARLEGGARTIQLQEKLVARARELQDALSNVKTLRGLLPICSYCKSVRDDKNYWQQVEKYLAAHAEVRFTHGICPECLSRVVG